MVQLCFRDLQNNFFFSPKLTLVNRKNISFSFGGSFWGTTDDSWIFSNSSVFYGIGTTGNEKASVTLGYGSSPNNSTNSGFIILGAELWILEHAKFLTENWITGNGGIGLYGIRFFGESMAGDIGFMRSLKNSSDRPYFFPWINFAYNFGSSIKANKEVAVFSPTDNHFYISYDFVTSKAVKDYAAVLNNNKFYVVEGGGGIFSSSDSDIKNGSGITLLYDRTLKNNFSCGFIISTAGSITNTLPTVESRGNYTYYNSSQQGVYYYRSIKNDVTVTTYGVHGMYSLYGEEEKDSKIKIGCGFGVSSITTRWMGNIHQGYNEPNRLYEFKNIQIQKLLLLRTFSPNNNCINIFLLHCSALTPLSPLFTIMDFQNLLPI